MVKIPSRQERQHGARIQMSTSDREGMVAKMATLLNELDQFGELLAAARLSSAIDALVEKSTND